MVRGDQKSGSGCDGTSLDRTKVSAKLRKARSVRRRDPAETVAVPASSEKEAPTKDHVWSGTAAASVKRRAPKNTGRPSGSISSAAALGLGSPDARRLRVADQKGRMDERAERPTVGPWSQRVVGDHRARSRRIG